ncbi:3-hydroxyisobutyryl-CoA hydrolase [Agromyces seonyuensis]|uniref:3-hydroxyisobutyryl-CoA hydrolase n=1 Tax=Agromyces seonyuensis TaxID=2662446 RepID=A0A6I4NW74_9MICO|nr:enoyl-CoA hydratase/isomerase family protein [Agromyces seonyuensis]
MEAPVLATVADGVGRLTLNRPRAINALNVEMVRLLQASLDAWADDSEVSVVLLDGAGERGFCAGGDLREISALAADGVEAASVFFREEYRLDAAIAGYPKPVVAVLDGIAMGGGIGLGGHARIRLVTERSKLAMPETKIGLFPDVGASRLLARAPGELGTFLALNSRSMDASDAIACGFADAYVPSDRLEAVAQALAERADPGTPWEIVLLFDETPEPSALLAQRDWIDACYSADSVSGILARLRAFAAGEPIEGLRATDSADADAASNAAVAAAELERLSPTGLVATLAALRAARDDDGLHATLERDFRLARRLVREPDLIEGIRAQVIDKDFAPIWHPADLAEVDAASLAAALSTPLPDGVFTAA